MKKMFFIPILLMIMSMIAAVMAPQNVSANNAGVVIKEKTQLKIPDKPDMKIVAIDLTDPTCAATNPLDAPDQSHLLVNSSVDRNMMILEKHMGDNSNRLLRSHDNDLWEMIARMFKKRRP